MGFNDPKPWGTHFYHISTCPGAWFYDGKWFETEGEAWEQYKKDQGPFDPNWTAAFDAKIHEGNQRKYKKYIRKWDISKWDRRYS